ncbi:MAG: hypothetical protein AAF193_03050, partial [Bacteroidota bacterium]
KKLEGVEVSVLQNGKQFDQFTTSGSAKYSLELPLGSDYIIMFSRNDYVTKKIEIKTKNIPEEDQRGGFQLAMDMSLFQYVEGFDISILDKPIGRAGFDPQKNSINFDYGYTESIKQEIDDEWERLEDLEKNMAKMLKQFEDLINKGDQKMAEEKYADAVDKYEDALEIFPDKEPAPEKLAEAQRKLDELNALAEKEADYLRLIEEGEKNMGKERYEDAQANYQDALDLKPNERLPKDKLKEIEGILADAEKRAEYKKLVEQADAYFKNEDYPVAIETYEGALDLFPNEEYPRDQINEAKRILDAQLAEAMEAEELEKKYNDLITLGDRNFDSETYRDAMRNYQQASDLKKDEKYPKDKIAEIEKILQDLEDQAASNAEADAENAEKERIDKEYQAAIDKANDFFDDKSWNDAKSEYERALTIKSGEKYPKSRIDRINQILDEEATLADSNAQEEERRRQEEERAAAQAAADAERDAQKQALEEEKRKREQEAEEERLRKEREQREADEAERRRREEFMNNANSSTEDEAERYYREARESEERAKVKSMEQQKEEVQTFLSEADADAAIRRKESTQEGEAHVATLERIHRDGEANREYSLEETEQEKRKNAENLLAYAETADYRVNDNIVYSDQQVANSERLANDKNYRDQKIIDSEAKKKDAASDLQSYQKMGDALRTDKEYDTTKQKEGLSTLALEGADTRKTSVESTEDVKESHTGFMKDTSEAADERRAVELDDTEKEKKKASKVGDKGKDQREEKLAEAEETKKDNSFLLSTKSEEAQLRAYDARQELFNKDAGSQKEPEEYIAKEDTEDLDEGVHERSYELGNKMIIERTVKRGNKVDTYKKVISKT